MKRSVFTVYISVAVVVGLCVATWAQPPGPENPPDVAPGADAGNIKQLVMDVLTVRLARELALNDEQTILMAKRFTDYRAQLEAFKKERQELTKTLRSSVSAKEPDAQIETKLEALTAQDAKIAEYKKSLYDSASAGLSTAQRAKLYVFLSDFENDMRKLIQKAREKSGQRPNRLGGPPAPEDPPVSGQSPRVMRNRIESPSTPQAIQNK